MSRPDSSCGPSPTPTPAALLVGGRSRRFGRDKARVEIGGEPLIVRNLRFLRAHGDPVWAVGPAPDAYADLGICCLPDAAPDAGPLGGILTALRHRRERLGEGACRVVAVDFVLAGPASPPPPVPTDDDRWFAAAPQTDHGWQPVYAAYHTRAITDLEAALAAGQRGMQRWLTTHDHDGRVVCVVADAGVPPTFNTPGELAQLKP